MSFTHTHPPYTPRVEHEAPTGRVSACECESEKEKDFSKIRITFRPLGSSIPAPARLRQLLKHALRHLDLRCERVEFLDNPEQEKHDG